MFYLQICAACKYAHYASSVIPCLLYVGHIFIQTIYTSRISPMKPYLLMQRFFCHGRWRRTFFVLPQMAPTPPYSPPSTQMLSCSSSFNAQYVQCTCMYKHKECITVKRFTAEVHKARGATAKCRAFHNPVHRLLLHILSLLQWSTFFLHGNSASLKCPREETKLHE